MRPRPPARSRPHRTVRSVRSYHPLARYIVRRLGISVLLLIGVTLVTFILTNLVPSNPAVANLGQQAGSDPKIVAAFNAKYGFNRPLPVQYVIYLKNLLHGDLGVAADPHQPVLSGSLGTAIPATMELALGAIVLSRRSSASASVSSPPSGVVAQWIKGYG